MAHQEGGWPLGLRPLNARVGLVRTRDLSGSISFSSTLLTGSSTSPAVSSSDLDTESTGSFFNITLGSLVGVTSILELSRSQRSTRGRAEENVRDRKNNKTKTWLFSLCSKQSTDAVNARNTSSLGNFLEAERRSSPATANVYRQRNQSPTSLTISDANSLFVGGGQVTAPQSSAPNLAENGGRQSNNFLHGNGYGRMGFHYYCRIRACLYTP
ncbi:hypothetical protein I3843_10G137000 [Carya illinoinensis]|nr:hypothetical protein I3843_10G137000 [Carya illinoinensis]